MNSNPLMTSTSNKRRSWVERNPKDTLVLTERDQKIIQAVWKYRFLASSQIKELFFGSKSKADRRLRELYDHGYLDRIAIPQVQGRGELVYALCDKGAELLVRENGLARKDLKWSRQKNKIQPQFLQHELNLAQFRMAVEKSIYLLPNAKLLYWLSGEEIKAKFQTRFSAHEYGRSNKRDSGLRPDAYFGIETDKGKLYFFVEIDRGTESLKVIQKKIELYFNAYSKGLFEQSMGVKKFRVLFVVEDEKRLKTILETTQDFESILFWATTLIQATSGSIFGQLIWRSCRYIDPLPLL
jgi:hypothetical protein